MYQNLCNIVQLSQDSLVITMFENNIKKFDIFKNKVCSKRRPWYQILKKYEKSF